MAVAAKILEVMKRVEKVAASKMEFGSTKYNYISEADLTEAIRVAMLEVGMVIVPTGVEFADQRVKREDIVTTYNGNEKKRVAFMADVVVNYLAIDTEDGSTLPLVGYGSGMDEGDKCTAKAMTAAFKVMQRQAFFIPSPSKDDPDTTASGAYNGTTSNTDRVAPETGEFTFKGGKHAGKTMVQVLEADRSYLEWIVNKSDSTPASVKAEAKRLLEAN